MYNWGGGLASSLGVEAILQMTSRLSSIGFQGLKPLFFRSLNVAAEAVTHKDYL